MLDKERKREGRGWGWWEGATVSPTWWRSGREPPADARDAGNSGSIPGSGKCPAGGNGYPPQHPCLESPTDRGVWWATVQGVSKSQTRLDTQARKSQAPTLSQILEWALSRIRAPVLSKSHVLKAASLNVGAEIGPTGVSSACSERPQATLCAAAAPGCVRGLGAVGAAPVTVRGSRGGRRGGEGAGPSDAPRDPRWTRPTVLRAPA